jgi:hypothetical protein
MAPISTEIINQKNKLEEENSSCWYLEREREDIRYMPMSI